MINIDDIISLCAVLGILTFISLVGYSIKRSYDQEAELIQKGYVHYDGWFLPKEVR